MTARALCTSDSRRAKRLRSFRGVLAGEAWADCRSTSVSRLRARVLCAGGFALCAFRFASAWSRCALRSAAALVCDLVFFAGAVGGVGCTERRRDLLRRGLAGGITLGGAGV